MDCLFTWADPIYKSLQTDSFLKLEEIPKEAKILGIQIELEFIKNKYGMLYQNQTNHLNTWVLGWALHSFHICYCWICVTIILCEDFAYLSDSHSGDILGMPGQNTFSINM